MNSGITLAMLLLLFLAAILFFIIQAEGGLQPTIERYGLETLVD